MPIWVQRFIVVSLFGLSSFSVVAEEFKCKYEEKFKDGASKGADTELIVVNGKIEKLVVFSFFASGKEGGGNVCGIDTSEDNQKIDWSTNGKKVILEVAYDVPSSEKSVLEIEPIGNTYKINLEHASHDACGFGADWPQYVVIEKGNPKCRVAYKKY